MEYAKRRNRVAHDTRQHLARIIGSFALGAVAMYAFDPDKGRRRRALARDKAYSLMLDTRHAAAATRRDVEHRLEGLQARTRRLWATRPSPDDLQLIERVRARMGRMVSHPHAIQVGALGGRITLSGPVLAHEAASLLAGVQAVWGVRSVTNLLVIHEHPESIPSLQGGIDPYAPHTHEHWPPALRAAALSSGVLLTTLGARQRSIAGLAIAVAGVALALRGVTNRSLARMLEQATAKAMQHDPTSPSLPSADQSREGAVPLPDDDASAGHALH
jgi:hypothetical protein